MTATQPQTKNQEVIAKGRSMTISTKFSIEICREIRNKPLPKAKQLLEDVLKQKRAIPIKRFNFDQGHKPGMGAARYPIATSKQILRLLHLLEANAEQHGFNPEKLYISLAKADRAEHRWHYGRQRGTRMKSTHIELRAREQETKK